MNKLSMKPNAAPDEYVASLTGWQQGQVRALRRAVLEAADLIETVKWGHLVCHSYGPVLLIRAEGHRVLLGFWRGHRLRHLESRLRAGGKYEMATIELGEGDTVAPAVVRRLTKEAVALNAALGNPTDIAN